MSWFVHESLHRSASVMARLHALPITICGAGAVGANLAESLARMGAGRLRVIDRDRVDARNLSTQPWLRTDVGSAKATLLARSLFRALKLDVEAHAVELTAANADRLLAASGLVVDAFDNSAARGVVTAVCARLALPCVHIGLSPDYAEVVWDERYRVPSNVHDDVCDYPLARNLVLLAVSIGAESMLRWIADGERRDWSLTLDDLAVRAAT